MLKCPIHELPGNIIIDNFYARLSFQDKTLLDTSCSGSFTRNKEEFKRDLLNRIQENTEGWENDKDRESGINYDYKCIEAFMDTDKFRNMSATYGLDSQVAANLYKAFASHYELPKKNFDKYHEPYKDKIDSSINKCVVVETVDHVIPEAYIEKTPFPAKMKEYSQHLENSESEVFREERNELDEIFLRQPILKHDLPVEDLGTTPPPKEDPVFDLKPLPDNLKYAHIDDKKIYPVIISSKLSEFEEERLLEILKKHRGAIGYTLDDLKGISPSICQHAINMEDDAKPVVEPQRRLIPKMKDVVRNEVLRLLEAGIIYPIADSRWVSHVHCVPKKGGMTVVPNDNDELIPQRVVVGYRMCIDYRKVNKVTKKDHYPLPFIDQMLERCMSAIFHGFCESIVEVFMDDFSVYGNSFDSCLRNLDKVLQRCEETNLVLNWEKCHFMVNEGIVLGHKISERGIEVDRAKVEAIEKMPYPRDVKDRKGADNPVADNLSRLENIAYDPVPVNDSFPNEQLAVIKTMVSNNKDKEPSEEGIQDPELKEEVKEDEEEVEEVPRVRPRTTIASIGVVSNPFNAKKSARISTGGGVPRHYLAPKTSSSGTYHPFRNLIFNNQIERTPKEALPSNWDIDRSNTAGRMKPEAEGWGNNSKNWDSPFDILLNRVEHNSEMIRNLMYKIDELQELVEKLVGNSSPPSPKD
ncbi:hypothetical protein QYE76_061157 [Lolium multiflorum]|uniref:Reverse transcriptase domain-containing protein n=1 Tax=Lolium multiflorum TaxID=4521 RepID=A0AAD8W778_LOLMU|nr:hypothetical protein QYE76_061157 [Lolium multiflorum]